MQTASGVGIVVPAAGSSSFGKYRLSNFIATSGPNREPTTTRLLTPERPSDRHGENTTQMAQMAQSSRPSSGQNLERPSSVAHARPIPQDLSEVEASSGGTGGGYGQIEQTHLELVELVSSMAPSNHLHGGSKDGRVKNPVPNKLKGKTDNKQGNFGVMHMGMSPSGKTKEMSGKDAATERDAAARRTSENTALRAKAAQQDKYAPPKRRAIEGNDNRGSPFTADHRQRAIRPLAPDETKHEQARLLTLLRSINPVTVVDQICKAVAYFGGIPGAPPPEDGIFPESATTKETGALFIGWLAEIFPDLSSPEVPKMQMPLSKKARGRVTKLEPDATTLPTETPGPRNGYGYGQAVGAPAWGLPQSLALVNTPDAGHQPNSAVPQPPNEQRRPATPTVNQQMEDTGASTGKRGRGRPKGSRNKGGKADQPGTVDDTAPVNGTGEHNQHMPTQASPVLEKSTHSEPLAYTPMDRPAPSAPMLQGYPDQPWQTNRQQKTQAEQEWQINNQKKQLEASLQRPAGAVGDELSPEEQAVLQAFRVGETSQPAIAAAPAPAAKGPQAGVKRKRGPNKPKVPPPGPPQPADQGNANQTIDHGQSSNPVGQNTFARVANMGSTGVTPQNGSPMGYDANSMGQSNSLAPTSTKIAQSNSSMGQAPNQMRQNSTATAHNPMGMGQTNDSGQWAAVDSNPAPTSSTPVPAPKRQRQRKPKAPAGNKSAGTNSPAMSLNKSVHPASSVGLATPPVAPSALPEVQEPVVPVSRPPAEGLEAHYERFASLPQQTARSHTPTVLQPQQQARNPQKTPSVSQQPLPHQSSAQQNTVQQTQHHQHQMQQQKSQQGNQRDDQKLIQGTAPARSSSTSGFYSQRNQTNNYNQPYPAQQTSQMYSGHQASLSQSSLSQASPQLSNTNAYRTPSTHSLAQASPQYTTAENTYRTTSPHTIPQPSPSFAQPDTNFRTASNHGLTQQPPAYSTSENAYRTSTHSGVQPSTSYTRPATQAQPASQGHYAHYADTPYVDLPTLESLGHGGTSSNANVGMGGGGAYGQSMGLNSSRGGSSSIYGTSSGLNSAYDTGSDLLRGVSRSGVSSSVYGTSSGLGGGAYDTEQQDMRDRMMRNIGRR